MKNSKMYGFMFIFFVCAVFSFSQPGKDNAKPVAGTTPAGEGGTYRVFKEPVTLTAMGILGGLYVDVKDYNEIPAIAEFSRLTNIRFEWQMPNSQNEVEQKNLSFATKKMPDIYTHMNKLDAIKYGGQGALIDLLPLIKQYAPNIMKALQADPSTLALYTTAEGKLYMLPQIDADYRLSTFKTIMIQQAWLDKLGLKTPTNPDELYKVLKAFKDNAAKLTEQKIIPYSSYFSTNMEGWFDVFAWGFGMYSARGYEKNGKIVFGALEPEFVEVMSFVNKLYREGLIDPDLTANKDDPTFEAKMTNNRVGLAYAGQGRIGTYNQKAGPTFAAYKFVPMIPVANKDGKVYFGAVGPLAHDGNGFSISINNKYPVETIKAWDWFFSEEGKIAMNLGVEGDTFRYVNGKAEYTDKIMKNPNLNANQTLLKLISPLYDFPCARIYDFERAQLGPVLADYKTKMMELGALNGVTVFTLTTLPVSAAQVRQFSVVEADINTYMDESLTKFIKGEWNLTSDYERFRQTLKNMNVDGLLASLNEGYKKMMSLK